jgi:hypothetical protein
MNPLSTVAQRQGAEIGATFRRVVACGQEHARLWRSFIQGLSALEALDRGSGYSRMDVSRRYNDVLMSNWTQDFSRTFRRICDASPRLKDYHDCSLDWHIPEIIENGQFRLNNVKPKSAYGVCSAIEHSYVFEVLSHHDEWPERFGAQRFGVLPDDLKITRKRYAIGRTSGTNTKLDGAHWAFEFTEFLITMRAALKFADEHDLIGFDLNTINGVTYNDA